MRRCEQVSAADWLVTSRTPWQQLAEFGPSGFEAYGRLRYVPDPQFQGQAETEVHLSAGHPSDVDAARRVLLHLAAFTGTPDECYFCVWDGITSAPEDGSLVAIPNRSYLLFAGTLEAIGHWEQTGLSDACTPPAFVWPADRRWCFASDIDPHWAGIGAERAAIDALVAASDIDVVYADPEVRQPPYA